jgi:hypothetical protein
MGSVVALGVLSDVGRALDTALEVLDVTLNGGGAQLAAGIADGL